MSRRTSQRADGRASRKPTWRTRPHRDEPVQERLAVAQQLRPRAGPLCRPWKPSRSDACPSRAEVLLARLERLQELVVRLVTVITFVCADGARRERLARLDERRERVGVLTSADSVEARGRRGTMPCDLARRMILMRFARRRGSIWSILW